MRAPARAPLDRSRPPAAGEPKAFTPPEIERRELSHGVQLLSVRDTTVPLLQLEWVLASGAQLDPPKVAGRAGFTASLLDEGTRRFSGPEISERIDRLGGSLACNADWEATYAGCAAMSWFVDEAMEILGEIVLHPRFPEREVERVRRLHLTGLRQRLDRPEALAADWVASLLYRGTPYGTPLAGAGEAIASLQRDDLMAFHAGTLAMPSTFVAVGDFDPDQLTRLLEESLADFAKEPGSPPGPAEIIPSVRPAGPEVWIVDRPGAAQTELRYAHAGPPRSDPDWPALRLLSALLGGKFTSRLMLSLRERHGITYGVSSRFVARRGPGPFVVSCAVETAGTGLAVDEIGKEIERLRTEAPPTDELRETADYLIGVLPQHFQGVEQIAEQIAALVIFDLGLDYLRRYPEEVRAVGPEDVLAAAQRHLLPQQAIVVAVGPAAELRSQLDHVGPVHVVSGGPATA